MMLNDGDHAKNPIFVDMPLFHASVSYTALLIAVSFFFAFMR